MALRARPGRPVRQRLPGPTSADGNLIGAPATEAPQPVFLTAEWRDLALINFEVEPGVLERFVPAGTQIDYWQGRCYVSIVGFRFLDTRLLGLPIPLHRDFEEVNLRFYVRRQVGGQVRRGVVFIKEIVPRRAVAWIARAVYNENYVALPMRHHVAGRRARYEWRLDSRCNSLAVAAQGPFSVLEEDDPGSYFGEHNWGYGVLRDGSTIEYRVDRPRWEIAPAEVTDLDCDVARLYGGAFAACLADGPASAFLARGSRVTVRRGRRIRPFG